MEGKQSEILGGFKRLASKKFGNERMTLTKRLDFSLDSVNN
jgi:hypothetical protein